MKTTNLFALLALVLFGFSSCSPRLSPFTDDLYEANRWTDEELKQIQFYLSEDIVLRRQVSEGAATIESGRIKMIDGKKVEEIVIRQGTPGIFLFRPKEDRFAVSFEDGDDTRFLMFGPSPKARGRYVLLASEWKRNRGLVSYEDRKFYTPTSSAYATLMVDLKRVRKVALRSRTAKGRSVN